MATIERIVDAINQVIWDVTLENAQWVNLKQKVFSLFVQAAVHHTLHNAAQLLSKPETIPNRAKSRLAKFIDAVYGPDTKIEKRLGKLTELDCATFLFIAISYTPLELTKLHEAEFNYLVENASKYLSKVKLPPRWMFSKDIQVVIAAKADVPSATTLRKGLFNLVFSAIISDPV